MKKIIAIAMKNALVVLIVTVIAIATVVAVIKKHYEKIRGLKSPLIFLSAFFFAVAFYGFYPLVFLFLVPLYASSKKTYSFFDGVLWGMIFFTIHSFGVLYVIWQQGVGLFSAVCPMLFVFYCSCYSGIWFASLRFFGRQNKWYPVNWVVVTFIYFWWVQKGLFWPFGKFEGYLLSFPLVPLMELPELAQGINLIGEWPILFCLIMGQILLIEAYKKRRVTRLSFFCWAPFFYGFFIPKTNFIPEWISKSAFIPLAIGTIPSERIYEAVEKITNHKQKQIFIFPESYFPFEITEKSFIIRALQAHALEKGQVCLFGAHKEIDNKLFNTVFLVGQRRIILCYEKTHLIPFFEYNPYYKTIFASPFNFFLHKKVPFSCGKNKPVSFEFDYSEAISLSVCSELFSNDFPLEKNAFTVIALLNDSHFGLTQFPHIMLLSAQFQALSKKRSLAYCSSFSAYFINQEGRKIKKIETI